MQLLRLPPIRLRKAQSMAQGASGDGLVAAWSGMIVSRRGAWAVGGNVANDGGAKGTMRPRKGHRKQS